MNAIEPFVPRALFAQQTPKPGFWMPVQASANAPATDNLFHLIFWISAFFFLLIMVLMVIFVVRYRRTDPDQLGTGPSHSTALELLWSGIPIAIVMVLFGIGFRDFMRMVGPNAAPNAYEIGVTGQKWKWTFTYPNGHVDDILHVPLNTPVQLNMTSEDVIHSFFVPAFRTKQDVVPGRYTKMFFRATVPGEFVVFCAEYCGTSHANMVTKIVVEEPAKFEKWLVDQANIVDKLPPAQAGERLFSQRGCTACHTTTGAAGIGPTMKGIFGNPQPLASGGSANADENYLRESILNPQAKIVRGFEPVMPTYQGRLKDKEVTAIIEYIKTLK